MDLTKITFETLTSNGNYANKTECMMISSALRTHALGRVPEHLINERRPHEPVDIKDYRAKIYVPKTKNTINKVIHSLEKIRRAQDWSIQYNEEGLPSVIAEAETLQRYCEENYPIHDSLTNWAFSELLRQSLLDPNGIVAVVMEKLPENKSEYCRPVSKFFECDQIVDFVEGEYAIIKSRDTSTYYMNSGKGRRLNTNGAIYYVLTDKQFVKYEQTGSKRFEEKQIYQHNIGKLPAWKVGGLFKARKNNDTIYESRLQGMVPDLDEAAREYSDLQAEIVMHVYSEKYAYTNTECPQCNGTGKVRNEDGKLEPCKHCGGTGTILRTSPYGIHLIDPARAGELQVPTPPIGYIQKSTEIARLQDERVRQHLCDALSAVNMEFLAEVPIAQSGVAKAYDQNELNNFVNAVAEDLVRNLDRVYYFINEYRYRNIVQNEEKRREMLPHINVPTKFDIVNSSILMQELTAASQAKVNPIILRELEVDYAKKQFNTSPETALMVQTSFNLDPLFGIATEDKMTMLQNKGITEQDYVISCNIQAFIRRAVFEDKDFCRKNYKEKMDKLRQYADEIKETNNESRQAASSAGLDFGGLGQEPQNNTDNEDNDNE